MPAAFRSATSKNVNGNAGSTTTLAKPAGVVAGDLLLMAIRYTDVLPARVAAGFTVVYDTGGLFVAWKIAGSSEPAEYDATSNGIHTAATFALLAFSGVRQSAPLDANPAVTSSASGASITAPSRTPAANGLLLALLSSYFLSGPGRPHVTPPAGMAELLDEGADRFVSGSGSYLYGLEVAAQTVAPGTTGTRTGSESQGLSGDFFGASLVLLSANVAPNAPTLVSPATGATLDATSGQRLSWSFSDPDVGDSQSKYDLRYRIVGAASWTTVTGTTTATHRDFAPGAFAAGDYEWQVRTYDAEGLVGPYSGSGFFTVATPPAGPSITDPANGATVSASTVSVVWSTPNQDAYQLRTVADSAGSPVTGTVYSDTGTVESASTRSRTVTFATNNRTEHIQVRVRVGGLWSAWASVRVDVSYTTPAIPVPTVLASAVEGAISVSVSNPAPSGGQPTVRSNDLWRREAASGGAGIRVAADRSPNGTWIDYTPASGVDYEYAVVANGSNGTTATSPWVAGESTSEEITYYGGGYA